MIQARARKHKVHQVHKQYNLSECLHCFHATIMKSSLIPIRIIINMEQITQWRSCGWVYLFTMLKKASNLLYYYRVFIKGSHQKKTTKFWTLSPPLGRYGRSDLVRTPPPPLKHVHNFF